MTAAGEVPYTQPDERIRFLLIAHEEAPDLLDSLRRDVGPAFRRMWDIACVRELAKGGWGVDRHFLRLLEEDPDAHQQPSVRAFRECLAHWARKWGFMDPWMQANAVVALADWLLPAAPPQADNVEGFAAWVEKWLPEAKSSAGGSTAPPGGWPRRSAGSNRLIRPPTLPAWDAVEESLDEWKTRCEQLIATYVDQVRYGKRSAKNEKDGDLHRHLRWTALHQVLGQRQDEIASMEGVGLKTVQKAIRETRKRLGIQKARRITKSDPVRHRERR
jgi:hypothetical protein